MTRRAALGAGAGLVMLAATGNVAAQDEEEAELILNFASELAPAPWLEGSAEIAEHRSSMTDLGYVNDNGDEVSLRDHGGVLAEREDEETPHNPVRYRADKILSDEFTDFPRGITRENEDEEEEDVSALDASEWSTTGSELTVEDVDEGLRAYSEGLSDGTTVTGTFEHEEFSIDSGEQRKWLQLVVNVDELAAGALVEVVVEDVNGNAVRAGVDPSGDESQDNVIATTTGSGIVYQQQLGELSGGQDLDEITTVNVEISDADADVTLHALNLEKEDAWSFGEREQLDEDEEIETVTVQEPTEYTGITSIEGLDDDFGAATIEDVQYDVEFRASELPSDAFDVEVHDTDRHDYGKILQAVGGWDLPTAYDLSIDLGSMFGMVRHSASRYLTAEIATGLDEVPTIEDVDDVDWTDRTSQFGDGDLDDELELSSTVGADSVPAFHFEINEQEDVVNDMTTTSGGGGAPAWSQGGGGIMSSMWGWVLAIGTGAASVIGLIRAGILGGTQ